MTEAVVRSDVWPKFGLIAYLCTAISLVICFWKGIFLVISPILGLTFIDLNPHLQAVFMWGFAAIAVGALFADRKRHNSNAPMVTGLVALAVIVTTLYTYYHDLILMIGYVLLLIAAFINQNRMLLSLNRTVSEQAQQLVEINSSLEQRVTQQVEEIERLARLKRFLPGDVADLVISQGQESMLESHRAYIACLFCDIRRFTSMTEAMEPEDVMDVLRDFHEEVGRLVVRYQGTIGYRAGDGVLVFFNDPIPCDDPDGRAVNLALEMRRVFDELQEHWRKLEVDVGLGIGIASGYATLGVIGVEGRFDYTPIGNAVNLASRLSDYAQDGEVLISRRTHGEIEDQVESEAIGDITLKGISHPVEAFRLKGQLSTNSDGPAT